LEGQSKAYEATVDHCLFVLEVNAELKDAHDSYIESSSAIRSAIGEIGVVSGFFTGVLGALNPASAATSLLSGPANAMRSGLQERQAELDAGWAKTQLALSGKKEMASCWLEVGNIKNGIHTNIEMVKEALLGLSSALLNLRNHGTELRNLLAEGDAAISREKGRTVPSLVHDYWLDEKVERFDSEMEWGRRLAYLAMRALEYEAQQSLSLRGDILQAAHPMQLENAVLKPKARLHFSYVDRGGQSSYCGVVRR
jgi:hypothetical protein